MQSFYVDLWQNVKKEYYLYFDNIFFIFFLSFVLLWSFGKKLFFITVQENTELKRFEQVQPALSFGWVQPMLHAGGNMLDQHLHCIIYTSRLISWVTMDLTVYEPKVISQQHEQTFSYCFSVR